MKKFNLNLVYYFIAIYEEKSLTRAAERLDVSQPSLSAHLKNLRAEYNDLLFERRSHKMEPTPIANDIYYRYKAAYDSILSTLPETSDFSPQECDYTFRIASMNIASVFLLPAVMKKIQSMAPDCVIEVVNAKGEMASEIREKRIDLILDITGAHSNLNSKPIWEDELCVVCSQGNDQFTGDLTLNEFLKSKHIMLARDGHKRNLLALSHSPYFEQRKVARKLNTIQDFADSIHHSSWLATLPKSLLSCCFNENEIKVYPLPFHYTKPSISLYWHQNRSADPVHKWLRSCFETA
ncbi:LysR family transcriptional regulator [Vibrio maerlii]|uniref:LysR family transcriptional regulator n=1 Tax=Vibrio maerlii TaxID=2231648 RepID=UPI000E3E4806|nr:LysR family transcriptional regulator [Vibrio maerlii]